MKVNFLDYDAPNSNAKELDAIAVKSLNEKGGVWYQKKGAMYYMDADFVRNVCKEQDAT